MAVAGPIGLHATSLDNVSTKIAKYRSTSESVREFRITQDSVITVNNRGKNWTVQTSES